MTVDTSGPQTNAPEPKPFKPSPVLLAMRKRARSLVRSARTTAYFKPRLRRRAIVATLAAEQRGNAERERWERNA